jgi:hypothetical protein
MLHTDLSHFTPVINSVIATSDYAQTLRNTLEILESLEPIDITHDNHEGNHIAHCHQRIVGFLSHAIVHFFEHRLTPELAAFYLQDHDTSYANSDVAITHLSSLIRNTNKRLSIIDVCSIAHYLLDTIVQCHIDHQDG